MHRGRGRSGACRRPTGPADTLRLTTVNACLALLPMLHGRALLTIEDVGSGRGPASGAAGDGRPPRLAVRLLHAGHRHVAVVHGRARLRHRAVPTRADLADGLAGNLCRCTGYRPILDAAEQAIGARRRIRPASTPAPILAGLAEVPADDVLDYRVRRHRLPRPGRPRRPRRGAGEAARCARAGRRIRPRARRQPAAHRGRRPSSGPDGSAGWRTSRRPTRTCVIGAAAPLEAAWAALAARAPALTQMWLRFASPAIRHTGTMGGNIVNGSPIGDSAPVLLALDARLVLRGAAGARVVDLGDFYPGYGQNRARAGRGARADRGPAGRASRGTCAPTSSAAGSTATSRRSAARSPRWSRTA